MATQGILSIVVDGRVTAKAITGADGYKMPEIAKEVRKKNVTTARGLLDLCYEFELGGESLIVQSTAFEWIGDCTALVLPDRFAEKFNEPEFNPRWERGTADYVEVVKFQARDMLKVGQKLYWVPSERYHMSERMVTVEKIGRKWATLKECQYRIDVKTLQADGGNYSSPGRCYLSREEYLAEKEVLEEWRMLFESIGHRPPAGVTVEDIRQAKKLLRVK